MKKILFVTPFLPYPPDDGGRTRMYNLIKYLSEHFIIDLFSLVDFKTESKYFPDIKKYCRNIYYAEKPHGRNLLNIFNSYPVYKNIEDEINRVLISNLYDIIQIEKNFMAPYVINVKDSILVADPWGIDFEGVYRLYRYEKNLIKKIRLYLSSLKIKVSEKKLIKKFDYVITVSLRDKSYYAEFLKNNKILLLPNCVDCDYFNPAIVDSKLFKNSLVFTGIMNYEPNIDAVIYFYNQIYPLIKKKVPSIKIFIAGKNPSEKLNFLRENSDFVITGYVEDIRQYLSSAEVCIIPMRMGGGTRFKVLEAMSMGKAVVSTSVGCEGIEADNNSNIIISDNPVEFADRTVYLLNNYDVIKKIGKNAREIILKKYNWGNIIKDYYEILNSDNNI